MPTKKRGALISRFEKAPEVQVFLSTDAGGVGLNLQAASVLINLDLPWNPAVLDQRIARVHRLGQRRTVRALLLVASDSYETQIMGLLGSKRALFANTIESGDEDVLGLSKRAVEAAMETLDDDEVPASEEDLAVAGTDEPPPQYPSKGLEAMASGDDVKPAPVPTTPQNRDSDVSAVVEQLQQALGKHLERVVVAQRGLIAVVDRIVEESSAIAARLSDIVPVVILDQHTYAALRGMGVGGVALDRQEVWRRPDKESEAPLVHPLEALAKRKLDAAEALVRHECGAEAIGLMAQAMLSSLASRAERDTIPSSSEAAVWLYGEAIPKGQVTAEDASAALRADALSRSESVPLELLQDVLVESRRIVLGANGT